MDTLMRIGLPTSLRVSAALVGILSGSLALFAAATLVVNDRQPHGDPPYLLEDGWKPLLKGGGLQGWTLEHPQKGAWTSAEAIFWDGIKSSTELLARPGGGTR